MRAAALSAYLEPFASLGRGYIRVYGIDDGEEHAGMYRGRLGLTVTEGATTMSFYPTPEEARAIAAALLAQAGEAPA